MISANICFYSTALLLSSKPKRPEDDGVSKPKRTATDPRNEGDDYMEPRNEGDGVGRMGPRPDDDGVSTCI